MAALGDIRGHLGHRHCHSVLATGRLSRLHAPATAVLAAVGDFAFVLRGPDAGRQNVPPAKEMDLTELWSVLAAPERR